MKNVGKTIKGCNVGALTEALCYQHHSVASINARHDPNTFSFRRLDRNEVPAALKEINPHKATGYDMLLPRVLKMTAELLATPLTTIFNQAIERRVDPDL